MKVSKPAYRNLDRKTLMGGRGINLTHLQLFSVPRLGGTQEISYAHHVYCGSKSVARAVQNPSHPSQKAAVTRNIRDLDFPLEATEFCGGDSQGHRFRISEKNVR